MDLEESLVLGNGELLLDGGVVVGPAESEEFEWSVDELLSSGLEELFVVPDGSVEDELLEAVFCSGELLHPAAGKAMRHAAAIMQSVFGIILPVM